MTEEKETIELEAIKNFGCQYEDMSF